jgi:NhaC family Na+:H+ antiporter
VAGAVLSGAYFGDKMSPLSDTTNMAPAMVGTDLYTHIKHMTYTTGVSYAITLVIEIALGFFYGGGEANLEVSTRSSPASTPNFQRQSPVAASAGPRHGAGVSQNSGRPGNNVIGIIAAAILGMIFQGKTASAISLSAAYGGYTSNSGVEAVDNLLTKGGFESMMYTVSLVICAMMFGGIMEKTNQLRVVVTVILKKAQSTGSVITATVLTAIGSNLILCDQYMSIVMTGKMYAQAYKDRDCTQKTCRVPSKTVPP